ncbi:uncharacterized protein LOC127565985 [Drosophila albomicans]|uniref:Uncharacterized protein LOC127565985 n=1 Tax=Drosophila albomicans TaxID=7291 RepID=A0A9C6T0U8_DROAB|nr:uncharacterized protein LOC127565985 [Drosophila albomicans]
MQIQLVCLILSLLMIGVVSGRTLFGQLFGPSNGGYYYQDPQQYEHSRPRRPQEQQRSYKDICRVVNTNGFTNPGNVPRCPY